VFREVRSIGGEVRFVHFPDEPTSFEYLSSWEFEMLSLEAQKEYLRKWEYEMYLCCTTPEEWNKMCDLPTFKKVREIINS